ncbi:MAG TPA: hypothetical protein VGC08_10085 [Pedobacter sp.]
MKTTLKKVNARKGINFMLLLLTAIVIIPCLSWRDPEVSNLVQTKWRGVLLVPSPIDGLFEFKKDSLLLYSDDKIVETMSYQEKGDTLILKKISGASPCNDEIGTYKCEIKNDVLTLTVLKDDCTVRSSCFSPDGYKKE